jgi:hypothetical protein
MAAQHQLRGHFLILRNPPGLPAMMRAIKPPASDEIPFFPQQRHRHGYKKMPGTFSRVRGDLAQYRTLQKPHLRC